MTNFPPKPEEPSFTIKIEAFTQAKNTLQNTRSNVKWRPTMSVQDMISDIQDHLNQLSPDELTVIWQLVQLLDAPKPVGRPEIIETQPR